MPVITAIERIRFKRRADVSLDGEKALSLSVEIIILERLAVGTEMTAERVAAISAEDERQRAVEGALRLLSAGPRSELELQQRLRRRGLTKPAVEAAVTRMRELGYLDDAAYARMYVESRQASTPRSRRYLAFELGRKGVDRALTAGAIEGVSDEVAAYEAAQRRLRSLRGQDFATFQRRLGAFLTTRGFGYGVARATVDRCWREVQEGQV